MTIPSGRPVRVGVTEKNQHPYWDMVNAGWRDAATALGLELEIEAPESEDVDRQLSMMKAQLDAGVDALAFVATRVDAFDGIVTEARRRGVPALTFDLDAPGSGRLAFVGMPPPQESASQIAQFLHERIPARSTVLAQTGSETAPGAAHKLDGFTTAMKRLQHPVVVGESDGEDVNRSLEIAIRLIEDHPEAAGMFGVYGYHPAVQARAVEYAGRADGIVIVGYDMLPETVDLLTGGKLASSVWIQEYYFGYHTAQLVNTAVRLGPEALRVYGMDPGSPARNVYLPQPKFFTPSNVGDFVAFRDAKELSTRTARITFAAPTPCILRNYDVERP